jgi:inosine triphosphate pyrophosphatase
MKDLIFITGNQHKADYLAKWLGMPVGHRKVDLDEIQSLDLREVVEYKAKQAYGIVGSPVLVEDVALTFHGMGRLPGPLIKWFLEELGTERLCALGKSLEDKSATASILYGLYDGKELLTFDGAMHGRIAPEVRSTEGLDWKNSLSWNSIFIPDGSNKTYAEMTDEELKPFSHRAIAIEKLKAYLTNS